jgi:hypothetical protein
VRPEGTEQREPAEQAEHQVHPAGRPHAALGVDDGAAEHLLRGVRQPLRGTAQVAGSRRYQQVADARTRRRQHREHDRRRAGPAWAHPCGEVPPGEQQHDQRERGDPAVYGGDGAVARADASIREAAGRHGEQHHADRDGHGEVRDEDRVRDPLAPGGRDGQEGDEGRVPDVGRDRDEGRAEVTAYLVGEDTRDGRERGDNGDRPQDGREDLGDTRGAGAGRGRRGLGGRLGTGRWLSQGGGHRPSYRRWRCAHYGSIFRNTAVFPATGDLGT